PSTMDHQLNWSARQELHLRSLGPRPSMLLLHYALMAPPKKERGWRTQDTKPWNRSCGKILLNAEFRARNAERPSAGSFRIPHLGMALPVGLAPTLFPQTTGCSGCLSYESTLNAKWRMQIAEFILPLSFCILH